MSSQVDICIITAFAPSLNPRMVKDADALSSVGYSVVVIAPDFSAWARKADKEFEDRPWRIVERPQFGPLSRRPTRVGEIGRRLAAGFAVRCLGLEHPAIVRAAFHPVAPALVRAAMRQKARLYLAHLPAALPAAAIAAETNGGLYAFDAEDFHPGELPDAPDYAVQHWMLREIEERYFPGCAYMTAASPGIADAYAAEYGIERPTVVLNTFPRSRAPTIWTEAGTALPGPSVYWFSQTIGADRGLQNAVRAIATSRSRPHLYLRGNASHPFMGELASLAKACGVEDRLHPLPMAPAGQMESLAAAYDVGLCGEIGQTRNNRIALSNKQFTYLLAGIPVLMSNTPSHVEFRHQAAAAVEIFTVDDPQSLAAAIDRILGNPARLALMRRTAWELGQTRFNAECEARQIVAAAEAVLGPAQ